MFDFRALLKAIRRETGLTQEQFASRLGVSTALIAMIESGQKPPSKKFIATLSSKMEVSPNSIIPFIYNIEDYNEDRLDPVEREIIKFSTKLQKYLIHKKAKNILK